MSNHQNKSAQSIPTVAVFSAKDFPAGESLIAKRPMGTKPLYKIIGETYAQPETVLIHTAGQNAIWQAALQDVVSDKYFLANTSTQQAATLVQAALNELRTLSKRVLSSTSDDNQQATAASLYAAETAARIEAGETELLGLLPSIYQRLVAVQL
ncbi:MAG: hypothetical protein R8K20_06125 [Gallionellaceae bacterium]